MDDSPPSTGHKEAEPVQRSRRKRLIWICVALFVAVGVAVAIVIAVLISKDVIHVGSRSGSSSEAAATSGSVAPSGVDSVSSPQPTAGGDSGSGSGSKTTTQGTNTGTSTTSSTPEPTESCPTKTDIPSADRGTDLDTTTWLDMTGFNCSYTAETVGDLPIVGLNSTWDDSARANPTVPPLNKPWGSYTARPARGVNLGGWLSLEPFITPSLFSDNSKLGGQVDEWNLCTKLGPKAAAAALEKHYATFITEQDFKAIADAGLDHLRIPFSYWAVEVFDDDSYVYRISWRYLLRGIEWARKYGLRIKLDLHGLPGSQNGWNHSGRSSIVNFLAGPNGSANAERALKIHDRLSKFFAQDRYKNVIAFYGLANEPAKAIDMDTLINWTEEAYKIVKDNGIKAPQVFSESMRGLGAWQGKLGGYGDSLVVDAHEYVIFDNALVGMKHADKVTFACQTFTDQVSSSMNTGSGFGPTMVGEWSQADTDCTKYLNGVGNGARWDGTFSDTGGVPRCPTGDKQCSCALANADPSTFSPEYKLFLKTWAIAQMDAYEKSWGWFYWTWKTESAPLWSYQAGLAGGIMPEKAYDRDWSCASPIPSFGKLPEYL
ncbi:hypothetical protein H072_1582 [Dactylellina haptotyla CBS 200.50]|uniref:glucan 1,3-beta-glucosidase n=1 Tax=Dactylellina haptotyla (strain CBS 200.50) TaxID=1284197 RepID=S8BY43_DACHA|nr:hypothetical protein H072_1582 [Dactylellina haptotyla CBS 200.50]